MNLKDTLELLFLVVVVCIVSFLFQTWGQS